MWLLACRIKLHWRIHVINPGWLEEWTTDWLGEEILVSQGLRLWARIHLEVKDLKVKKNYHQPRQQGDDDSEPSHHLNGVKLQDIRNQTESRLQITFTVRL